VFLNISPASVLWLSVDITTSKKYQLTWLNCPGRKLMIIFSFQNFRLRTE